MSGTPVRAASDDGSVLINNHHSCGDLARKALLPERGTGWDGLSLLG